MTPTNKIILALLILLSSPVLLFVFQPAWQLGGLGLMLGFWGMYLSPVLLLIAWLIYLKISPLFAIGIPIAIIISLYAVYHAFLFVAHDFSPNYVNIDSCIDYGGAWDYEKNACPIFEDMDPCDQSGGVWVNGCHYGGNPLNPVTGVPHEVMTGEQMFSVSARQVDCQGVAPQKCLIVDGEYFYDTILGFDFEEGYEYYLKVNKEKAFEGKIPADASMYKYTLIEIISKKNVK